MEIWVCLTKFYLTQIAQLDYSLMETQALVLGPTRELAQQIEKARIGCSLSLCCSINMQLMASLPPCRSCAPWATTSR